MKIHLFSIGKTKEQAYAQLEQEYAKRLRFPWKLDIHYFKNEEALLATVKEYQAIIIALDEKGKEMTSQQFSKFIDIQEQKGEELLFIIGDTEGLSPRMKQRAQQRIALSLMTFPHELARVIFLEQLYRAQTILTGHPYHR